MSKHPTRPRKGCSFADLAPADVVAEWHPTKNGGTTPYDVTKWSNFRAWWRCGACGHEWETQVGQRSRGRGCKECAVARRRGVPRKSGPTLAAGCPELLSQIHPTKNKSSNYGDLPMHSSKEIWWTCDHQHEWKARISSRAKGSGCPVCLGRLIVADVNSLQAVCPETAKDWHPGKNGDRTPENTAPYTPSKAWWLCSDCGHEWEASVNNRSRGDQCPGCVKYATSEAETRLREWIRVSEEFSKVHRDANATLDVPWRARARMNVDVFATTSRTNQPVVVEYDGQFWHNNELTRKRDMDKTRALLDAGYLVVRIREGDLPFLPIEHENLLQVQCWWLREEDELIDTVVEIEAWLQEMHPEATEADGQVA